MSRFMLAKDIYPMFIPIRQRLAELEQPANDLKSITERLDTLDMLTNRHLSVLESYAPSLIYQANKANAQAAILIQRLEAAVAEQEAWDQREAAKFGRMFSGGIGSRLRWLFGL